MDNNYIDTEARVVEVSSPAKPVGCPGKEITGMILGINALTWPVLGLMFCIIPISGGIISIVYGLLGVGCAIPAMILYNKVNEQADYMTKKIITGRKLAIAGLIVGAVGVFMGILAICLWVAGIGIGANSIFSSWAR